MLVITDGNNNVGKFSPLEGANIARSFGIDVFAIGIHGKKPIDATQQQVGGTSTYFEQVCDVRSAVLCPDKKFFNEISMSAIRKFRSFMF